MGEDSNCITYFTWMRLSVRQDCWPGKHTHRERQATFSSKKKIHSQKQTITTAMFLSLKAKRSR